MIKIYQYLQRFNVIFVQKFIYYLQTKPFKITNLYIC